MEGARKDLQEAHERLRADAEQLSWPESNTPTAPIRSTNQVRGHKLAGAAASRGIGEHCEHDPSSDKMRRSNLKREGYAAFDGIKLLMPVMGTDACAGSRMCVTE